MKALKPFKNMNNWADFIYTKLDEQKGRPIVLELYNQTNESRGHNVQKFEINRVHGYVKNYYKLVYNDKIGLVYLIDDSLNMYLVLENGKLFTIDSGLYREYFSQMQLAENKLFNSSQLYFKNLLLIKKYFI